MKLLTVVAFLMAFLSVKAQNVTYYTSSNTHRNIKIDKNGDLWSAGDEALYHFDGEDWEITDEINGSPINYIQDFGIDTLGNLWICTFREIMFYNGTTWTQPTTLPDMQNSYILEAEFDDRGRFWLIIYSFTNGSETLYEFDGENWNKYGIEQGLVTDGIQMLEVDRDYNLWAIRDKGISKFDGHLFSNFMYADTTKATNVRDFEVDYHGNAWLSTGQVILEFDGKYFTEHYPDTINNPYTYSICARKDSSIWLGTNSRVYFKSDSVWNNLEMEDTYYRDINDMVEAADSNMYAATSSGILFFTKDTIELIINKNEMLSNYSQSVHAAGSDSIWVATQMGLSLLYQGQWQIFDVSNGIPVTYLLCTELDRNNNIWVGGLNGAAKLEGDSWTHYKQQDGMANDTVVSISADDEGNMWFGTFRGLSKYDGSEWTTYTQEDGLVYNWVNSVFKDKDDNIWFGTTKGISRFDGENWESWTPASTENGNYINTIQQDVNGNMYFGTNDGAWIYSDGFWVQEKMSDTRTVQVKRIRKDSKENLWAATSNGGLMVFNGVTVKAFDYNDGVNTSYIRSVDVDSEDNVWFATSSSLGLGKMSNGMPSVEIVVSDRMLILDAVEEDSISVTITTFADWELSSVPEWVSVGKTKGKGNDEIKFKVSDNTSTDRRIDAIIIKYDNHTFNVRISQSGLPLSIQSLANGSVLCYPNPVSDQLNIKLAELSPNAYVEIYNANGMLKYMSDIVSTAHMVNVNNYVKGMYLIKVYTGDKMYNHKILIK